MIMLNLYYLVEKMIDFLVEEEGIDGESDLRVDYDILSMKVYNLLDPAIRVKLHKKGMSISQNVYTGLDTEYKNVSELENKLISVQLAINSKSYLRIPRLTPFKFASVNTLSGKIFTKTS